MWESWSLPGKLAAVLEGGHPHNVACLLCFQWDEQQDWSAQRSQSRENLFSPWSQCILQFPYISANWFVPGWRMPPADLGHLGLVILHFFPSPFLPFRLGGKAELHRNPPSSCCVNTHWELNAHLCSFQLSSAFFWKEITPLPHQGAVLEQQAYKNNKRETTNCPFLHFTELSLLGPEACSLHKGRRGRAQKVKSY